MNNLTALLGVSNGIDIIAEIPVGCLDNQLVIIEMTHDYIRNPPPGFPVNIAGCEVAKDPYVSNPKTIAAGTVITVAVPESDALIAAGVAKLFGVDK